jgi:hypothetical protein
MSDLDQNLGENNVVHEKKHDHSVLGKHTKKDKEKYLKGLIDNKDPITDKKSDLNQKNKAEHVKKHDHSILGKHTQEDKQKYLEGLKKNENPKMNKDEHMKKDDHSFLGKHTPEDKRKYLEGLVDKKEEPVKETTPDLEPALPQTKAVKKRTRRRSNLI